MSSFLPYFACLALLLAACAPENEEVSGSDCGETVSLAEDVQPVISAHCAISGCHVADGQWPDFTDPQHIIDEASNIQQRTQSRTMPPPSSGITLTDQEIATLSCWVDRGALDN